VHCRLFLCFEVRKVHQLHNYTIVRARKTERQRDRETERQKDIETDRQKDIETDRQKDIETEKNIDFHFKNHQIIKIRNNFNGIP
jgi:hypothetical protein